MASVLRETAGLYETLKTEWNKKNPNLNKCGEILTKLKVRIDLRSVLMPQKHFQIEFYGLRMTWPLSMLLANVSKHYHRTC